MTEQVKPAANYAPVYAAAVYPSIVPIFRRHGYALAVHGSLARDFDLIAVPWTEAASEPFDVVEQLIAAFAIRLIEGSDGIASSKPHGRVAYTLSIGHGECAIDLSFMPRRTDASPLETGRTDHSEQPLNMVDKLDKENAALRFEIGSLQEQNRILGDCYTEGGVMTENGACYPTCGVPHSHGITHAVGCPNGFVAQTWSDFGVDSMSEAFVLCRNQRAENAALRERVAELENELNQHPEECCKDDRA